MKQYYYLGKRITKTEYLTLSKKEIPLKQTLYIKESKEIESGVCSICGCTIDDPCVHPDYGTCCWANEQKTICSWCAEGVLTKQERKVVMHRYNSLQKCIKNKIES